MRSLVRIASEMLVGAVLTCGISIDAAHSDDETPTVVEEIIVTATRRETALRDTSLSVSVLTAKDLDAIGAIQFADYAIAVPGLSFGDLGLGGEKHAIRGIQSDTQIEISPLTEIYFDEIPLTAVSFGVGYVPNPVLIDIDRIEVLRGPQGTLFGSASMGGAIRIIPNAPDPAARSRLIEAEFASTDNGGLGYSASAMVNLPLLDGRAAFRAAGFFRDDEGYIDNLALGERRVNDDETQALRLSLSGDVTDRLRLSAKLVYQNRDSHGSSGDDVEYPEFTQYRETREPNDDKWTLFILDANYEFDWGSLIFSTGVLDRDVTTSFDGTPDVAFITELILGTPIALPSNGLTDDRNEILSQELRLMSTTDGRLSWLAGLFYQDLKSRLLQDNPTPGFDAATGGLAELFGAADSLLMVDVDYRQEQIAVFGNVSYALTPQTDLSVGARWFRFDQETTEDRTGFFNGGPTFTSTAGSETGVTPRVSLIHRFNDSLSVYGNIAEGFRPGGQIPEFSVTGCGPELDALGLSDIPASYESDSLVSYEAGARIDTRERRVSVSAAAYHIDWKDMQALKFLDCGAFFVENTGKATSDGLELEFVASPQDQLEISLTAAYMNAELTEDVPSLGGMAGDPIPGVPEFTASLAFDYQFSAFSTYEGYLHADYRYVGSSFNDFDLAERLKVPAYDLLNLRVGVRTDFMDVSLFVNNIFNERGIVAIHDFVRQWEVTTRPRTVGINLRWANE